MTIIGLICEYNPFHNGHLYHLKKIKEKYPDSLLILCLNGYFLERGEISIINKFAKVQIALENNIDIVIELPLMKIAKKQEMLNQTIMKKHLKQGDSYSKSLIKSLNEKELKANDLLGVSYCKAILNKKLNIELETILRTNDFNDTKANDDIVSAQNIREKIKNKIDITNYLPKTSKNKIVNINYDLYFKLLKHKILTDFNLKQYLDVNEGNENLLIKEIKTCNNYDEFLKKIKSKRYNNNRLQRMLLHINLGILKKDAKEKINYVRILGFNLKGKNYLNQERKNFKLPTKIDSKSIIRDYELKASLLYDLLTGQNTYQQELKNKPIYINTADNLKASNQK